MGFIKLKYNDKIYTKQSRIIEILKNNKFYWLIDSEIIDADIEILNNTLIWNDGEFLLGDWYYGIFKNGIFHGNWLNGIFEKGSFEGKWISGINLTKK